jgi:hypothetical protein
MTVPDTLAGKLELWREAARVEHYSEAVPRCQLGGGLSGPGGDAASA